jgi:hypothetical protein
MVKRAERVAQEVKRKNKIAQSRKNKGTPIVSNQSPGKAGERDAETWRVRKEREREGEKKGGCR